MKEFKVTSPYDGLELSCLVVKPRAIITPVGIVQLLHGMCEHKERYIPFMQFLAANGYICVIHDHRGHGASVRCSDDLGYMGRDGWKAIIEDAKAVSDWARAEYPGLKLHLLGHSMGSIVARCYAKRYDDILESLIICGCPSDNPAKGVGKLLAFAYGRMCGWHYRPALLQKMSFGTYNKAFASEDFPNAWVCSDLQTLKDYHSDPLCQYVFTADGFYNLMCLMQDCYSAEGWVLRNPGLNVRFVSGEKDPCRVSDSALHKAVNLMKKVGYSFTDARLYPGMRHEILNETDKLTVWNDIIRWYQPLQKIRRV